MSSVRSPRVSPRVSLVPESVPVRELPSLGVRAREPGAHRGRRERGPISPAHAALITAHAQLAPLLLDLTYEVPLTSCARRHRFSQRSLSFCSGSLAPGPDCRAGFPGTGWRRCPSPPRAWGSDHSRARAGEEVPWEPWPSITEATSTKSQAIRREGRRPAHSPGSHRQDVRRSQGGHSYDLFKCSLQSIYFYTEVRMCADDG